MTKTMKTLQLALIAISTTFAGALAHAELAFDSNSCGEPAVEAECLRYLRSQYVPIDKAIQGCKGNVSAACLQFARGEYVPIDKAIAGCKGGVTVECLEYLRSQYVPIEKALQSCKGQ